MAIVEAVNELANSGKRVIVAGFDQDYMGRPFEPMPQLLSVAEFITKTHAICVKCGSTANYSQRTSQFDRARRSRRKRQIRSALPQMFRPALGRADDFIKPTLIFKFKKRGLLAIYIFGVKMPSYSKKTVLPFLSNSAFLKAGKEIL